MTAHMEATRRQEEARLEMEKARAESERTQAIISEGVGLYALTLANATAMLLCGMFKSSLDQD